MKFISFLFVVTSMCLVTFNVFSATKLVNPEWEFFDDFEGTIDNTFWQGGTGDAKKRNYGVDRPEATSKVLEMKYYKSGTDPQVGEGTNGDSWTEYDFNLAKNGSSKIKAVQVEVSFKIFTPANYVPVENNHKFFYLFSGKYGHANANVVVNSSVWGNGSISMPSINVGVDQINFGQAFNRDQIPSLETTETGEWATYEIFLQLAREEGDYGFYEIFKDGVLLTATYAPKLSNWGWVGENPNFDGNKIIGYASSRINNGGNFIDQGTLLGWANGDENGGGFQSDTKFLIDDFRVRANSKHGEVKMDSLFNAPPSKVENVNVE